MSAKETFGIIKELAEIESPFGKEEKVREYALSFLKKNKIPFETDLFGNVFAGSGRIMLCAHMDKLAEPGKWVETKETVKARLDDAMGMGISLDLAREGKFSLLFTVMEEPANSVGAQKALARVKQLSPPLIIVLETTRFGEKGNGPILYLSSAGVKFGEKITSRIREIAKKSAIPLPEIENGWHNDSKIFAGAGLPAVALEIHTDNNHSAEETSSKKDILQLKKLLQIISEEWLPQSPSNGQD